jgi:beta-lactam-binding protein with PASTA domain
MSSSVPPGPSPPVKRGFFGWVSSKPKTAFWITSIVALIVGVMLGAASASSDKSTLDEAKVSASTSRSQLAAERKKASGLKSQVVALQSKLDKTAGALKTTNVALKRATAKAEVPKFVGSDAGDAEADGTVDQMRWKITRTSRTTSSASPGTVLAQRPAAGVVLKGGKTISLVVAKKPPPKPKQWVTIKSLSGASSTKTPEFRVPSGFKARLVYSMPEDGNNAITLYKAPSEYVDLLLNEIGPQHGSTRMYEPGTFYLDVTGAYTIQIQVFKRPS